MSDWMPRSDADAPQGPDGRRPATRVVHAGPARAPQQGEPFLPGPVLAAPFHLAGRQRRVALRLRARGNPTWSAYEEAVGELEGGEVGAVLLRHGGRRRRCSWTARGRRRRRRARRRLPRRARDRARAAAPRAASRCASSRRTRTRCAPRCPARRSSGSRRLEPRARRARRRGARRRRARGGRAARRRQHARDAAHPAPARAGRRPRRCPAPRRCMTGHSDLMLGYVAARDPARAAALRTGAARPARSPGRSRRGSRTARWRRSTCVYARQCATALRLAEALAARDDVPDVRYPGLPSHPAHALAARTFGGRFGCVVALRPRDRGARASVSRRVPPRRRGDELRRRAQLGRAPRCAGGWTTSRPGFIRFSCGLEDARDVIADVLGALDAVR